jgi:ADP-heptose:LPS heptosyltransferase
MVRRPEPAGLPPGYVVVHPGASVPARACPPERMRQMVVALAGAGHLVVVTGSPQERELTRYVAGDEALDLGGRTRLAQLAGVLAGAACVVCANTGPAHLAAAVGTPVVSLFAPTVPFGRWAPYRVPHVRLGDPLADCRGSRAPTCPVPGHPCLSSVSGAEVVAAVNLLVGS